MVVIDAPIMSAEIFRALAGMLSIPVDFDALRLQISEITSNVLISVNLNIDSRVGDKLLVNSSSGESSISEGSIFIMKYNSMLKHLILLFFMKGHFPRVSILYYRISYKKDRCIVR